MSYEEFYPNGWQSGEAGGTPITPEALNHMEEGIKGALRKDGSDTMAADLPMGGNKITGLGTPTEEEDAVPLGYANKNFAPAGFGLGGTAKYIPNDDTLKGHNANGWYYWSASNSDVDKPFDAGSMFVIRRSLSYWTQIAIHDATDYPYIQIRKIVEGAAKPWEWLNPPMVLGVEYRTTERYLGNAVYTKLVNLGVITLGETTVSWTEENLSIMPIRYAARFLGQTLPKYDSGSILACAIQLSAYKATIACVAQWIVDTGSSLYLQVWYTK